MLIDCIIRSSSQAFLFVLFLFTRGLLESRRSNIKAISLICILYLYVIPLSILILFSLITKFTCNNSIQVNQRWMRIQSHARALRLWPTCGTKIVRQRLTPIYNRVGQYGAKGIGRQYCQHNWDSNHMLTKFDFVRQTVLS